MTDDNQSSEIFPYMDYSASAALLTQNIQKQYPQLSNDEVEILGNSILQEVSRRVGEGEKLAFFSRDTDGNTTLSLIGFEILDNNSQSQNLLGLGNTVKKSNG